MIASPGIGVPIWRTTDELELLEEELLEELSSDCDDELELNELKLDELDDETELTLLEELLETDDRLEDEELEAELRVEVEDEDWLD